MTDHASRPLSDRILAHLKQQGYRPQRPRRLAKSMGVQEGEFPVFREAVKSLMRAGRVVYGTDNAITLPDGQRPDSQGRIVGVYRGHPRGFGFVVPSSVTDHGDLFIPPGSSAGAITGDTVAVQITGRGGKPDDPSSVEGRVVEIIERGQSRFVGQLVRQDRQWLIVPDGKVMLQPILLGDVGSTRARQGDQVVVEITEYADEDGPARGVIVQVLGRHGDPEIDTLSMIHQYHFRTEFPREVLHDARAVIQEYSLARELEHREDLRDAIVVTIDPDDAKDYDDAISIRPLPGGMELGVHIADVSTFVQPGRPLDDEATQRCNSIYFPKHVIPMLPEVLSNGLCSLQEGEPRLCKSAFITYDKQGKRLKARFANTVIQSNKRLTYRQATGILDGEREGFTPEVVQLVERMDTLARRIQQRRHAAGMVVLELPEVELKFNEQDQVIDVEPADTSFSHTIIEMFMVEANEVVAELFTNLQVPHLRRVHAEPPPDAQAKLVRFLRVLGRPVPKVMDRDQMLALLASVRGKPESFAVNLAVLRSMAQAEYSPKLIGHFALASRHYAHFTSPIRRYPDLLIHRLLQKHLEGTLGKRGHRDDVPSTDALTQIGRQCSYTERRAEAAERELRQVKILRLLEHRLGDVEEGLVTGVSNIGLYVQLRRYLIDGLIRFRDLPDDWWDIHVDGGCVVGQRSRARIAIGDPVEVQIVTVDVAARELTLALTPAGFKRRQVSKGSGKDAPPPTAGRGKPRRTVRRPTAGQRGKKSARGRRRR